MKKLLSTFQSLHGETSISNPTNFRHVSRLNTNLDWAVADPAITFKLGEKIGEGSFAEVHKGEFSGNPVAIKLIDATEEVDVLTNEVEIMKQCNHPNIVKYYGSCTGNNLFWIIMDLCELGSIRDIFELSERTLTEREIACVCKGALQGLDYLHTLPNPIVHSDIKCANVFLTRELEIKIADFGVAKFISKKNKNAIEGTPHWMPPETGTVINTTADIWQIGITAIEMAEGRPPYSDMNQMRAMHMIRRNPPPTLTQPSNWSIAFNSFISVCLVKDYRSRPSAAQLLQHPFVLGADTKSLKKLCKTVLKKKKQAKRKNAANP